MSNHSSPSVNSYEQEDMESVNPDSYASNQSPVVHARFANSPILLEKGLNADKIDHVAKTMIRTFGWKKFVRAPTGRVNISVVREFYSSLSAMSVISANIEVMVRGVAVPFSPTHINELFEIPPVTLQHFELQWGLNDCYNHLNKAHEAFQFMFPLFDETHDMSTNALLPHYKAWKRFINSRIYPTFHFGSLSDQETMLLYALARGEYVNWGILIYRTLYDFVITPENRGRPLPYSWMISRLCVQIGRVEEMGTDEFIPSRNSRVGLLPVDTPGCSSTI